jgi:AraC family transcriptional regulator, transcriptional activator of pobA
MKETPIIPILKFGDAVLPFKIYRISNLHEEKQISYDVAHSHDYYEITWITNGTGKLFADLREYSLDENSLYFIKPNQVHRLLLSGDAQGFILTFKDSFVNLGAHEFDLTSQASLFQLFFHLQVLSVQKEMVTDMMETMIKMVKEFKNEYSFKAQLLRRYLIIFLIYVNRQFEKRQQSTHHSRETELTKSFMELLEQNFKEKKMVADYADELYITPNYLNGIVKKNTGFSAGHHIRQRVVLEAKRMCRYSDTGMKEIAYNLGFVDSSHFSKFFKAVSGMNFSDFKKEGRKYSLYSQQGLIVSGYLPNGN